MNLNTNEKSADEIMAQKIRDWVEIEKVLGARFHDQEDAARLIDYSAELAIDRDVGLLGVVPDVRGADWEKTSAVLLREARLDAAASRGYSRVAHMEAAIARSVAVKSYYLLLAIAAILIAICARVYGFL